MKLESLILRTLAVLALLTAILVMSSITFSSGLLGGAAGGSETPSASQESAEPTPEPQTPPTSTALAEEAPVTEKKTYVIEDGDSFYSIARKFNTTISDIQKLNPNTDPQNLSSGAKLVVP